MISRRIGIITSVALVLFTGCLPYSCRREESTALFSTDSLSRDVAAGVPSDSLRLSWARTGAADVTMKHPRTVRFGPDASGRLYVSDAEAGLIFVFDTTGTPLETIETTEVPYLAGIQGDTVAVFDPGGPAFHLLVDGAAVETIEIGDSERSRTALIYGAYGKEGLFYKRVDADGESFLAGVGRDGSLTKRWPLEGPSWRHAGLLKVQADSLLSLSGFRPVVDIASLDGPLDTLALRGFDSPMLSRSYAYAQGDVDEPPLLTSSAAPLGSYLFVLNMRAGWLQVDVFREGKLVRSLVERSPSYRRAFFPQDMDVRALTDGRYAVAVAYTQPRAEVKMYVWDPAAPL